MQIVIDIDVRAYNKCLKLVDDNDGGILGMHLINAVANGTPLPKGHGKLIDKKEAEKMIEEAKVNSEQSKTFAENIIKFSPTIIEADKEVNE